jgi:hypothetical protein
VKEEINNMESIKPKQTKVGFTSVVFHHTGSSRSTIASRLAAVNNRVPNGKLGNISDKIIDLTS